MADETVDSTVDPTPAPALDAQGKPVGESGVTGTVKHGTSKADIDHVNIWMRGQPWYQEIVAKNGGHADSDQAKKEIISAAQNHGVVIDEGNFEVDNSGNLRGKGHKLRNTLIVAAIVGATIATMGAAGVFAAAGAPGVAGTVGADAALEAGITTGAAGAAGALGTIPAIAASTGGLEAAGIGAGLAGAAGGAGAAGLEAAAPLASTATGTGLATAIPATGSSLAAGGAGTAGTVGTIGKLAQGAKTAGSLGSAISNASSGAGNTRRADFDTNVSGQSAFETELMNRAKLEAEQRKSALQDVYRKSASTQHSPYNPSPSQNSPAYTQALSEMEQQGMNRLQTAPQYGTDVMQPLAPYVPTKQGTVEKIGSYVGPALSTAKSIYDIYNGAA